MACICITFPSGLIAIEEDGTSTDVPSTRHWNHWPHNAVGKIWEKNMVQFWNCFRGIFFACYRLFFFELELDHTWNTHFFHFHSSTVFIVEVKHGLWTQSWPPNELRSWKLLPLSGFGSCFSNITIKWFLAHPVSRNPMTLSLAIRARPIPRNLIGEQESKLYLTSSTCLYAEATKVCGLSLPINHHKESNAQLNYNIQIIKNKKIKTKQTYFSTTS